MMAQQQSKCEQFLQEVQERMAAAVAMTASRGFAATRGTTAGAAFVNYDRRWRQLFVPPQPGPAASQVSAAAAAMMARQQVLYRAKQVVALPTATARRTCRRGGSAPVAAAFAPAAALGFAATMAGKQALQARK